MILRPRLYCAVTVIALHALVAASAIAQEHAVSDSPMLSGDTRTADSSGKNSASPASELPKSAAIYVKPELKTSDLNRDIYYANKLEFGADAGYLPDNIPFLFDRMVGIHDRLAPRVYTLVPIIFSLRWHFTDIGGRWIFRGNWDFSLSGAYTMIPKSVTTSPIMPRSGAETRYFSHMWGIRRNFVQPNWRVAPYWEGRIGVGNINAKEPAGALWAQGQDLTFNVMMGLGLRYNFSPKYSLTGGVSYMHISNLYLSEPRYPNYGINVYGPSLGFNMRLGKPRPRTK